MRFQTGLGLSLLLVSGGLLRAGYLFPPIMDSDQAIHGLQARHILLGEFGAFQWGLAYIGTFQAFLDALAFALLGSSRLVLNVIPLLLSLLFIVVTYRLGYEMGGERIGLLAAALAAIAPPYLAIYGAWARHGYMDTLLLGSVVLLVSLRLARRPLGEAEALRLYAILGLVSGLAWWTNFLSLYYLAPAALFLLVNDWSCLRKRGPWVALTFFLVGSAPFWVFNLFHSFWSLNIFKGWDVSRAPRQLLRVVTEGLPEILGARVSYSRTNLVPIVSEGVLGLYAVAFVWLLGREVSRFWTKRETEPGPSFVLLFFGCSAFLLSLSRYGEAITVEGTKRYLLPLYSGLPLLYALFLARVWQRSSSLFMALVILTFSLHLYGNVASYPVFKGEIRPFYLAQDQNQRLFRFLKARGVVGVYATDYWLAPRLTFDAGEEIIFAQPFDDRYPPYTRLVDAASRVAYIFAVDHAGPFGALLRGIGAGFERTVIGAYEIFHDFRPPAGAEGLRSLPGSGWRATASSLASNPAMAFDRDIDSAWHSGETQRPGLYFQVDLGRPTPVGKAVLLSPRPSQGFPRRFRVEVSGDGQRWEETAAVAVAEGLWSLDWRGGQPRLGARGRVVSAFEPREVQYVRIGLTGRWAREWWDIGEVFLYGPASRASTPPQVEAEGHLERGRAYEAEGKVREAIAENWRAVRLDPELEVAHARLAFLYEQAGIPLEVASPPGVRALAFEKVGLWAKAAREHEKEVRRVAHHQHHTALWQRLLRAYREAGEAEEARRVEERLRLEFTPAMSAAANFDNQVRFLGYRLEPSAVWPGQRFQLTYYWQALRPTKADYAFFVHFVREGKVLFQNDHRPLNGAYPVSQWQEGEVVREAFDLVIPEGLPPGLYHIVLGVWEPKSGQRLRVRETALAHKKDRAVVGTIPVLQDSGG